MPEQHKPDPYARSERDAGTVFQFDSNLLEGANLEEADLPSFEVVLDRPTKTGSKDDTSTEIPVVSIPGEPQQNAKALPVFVRENGEIDSINLRTMVITSFNRPGVKFVQGSVDKVSDDVAYEIAEWVTGVTKPGNQSTEEFFTQHESTSLMSHLYRESPQEFRNALDKALKGMGRAISPDPLPGTEVNLASLIKMDPVGACVRLINTISPYDGSMGYALLKMREICLDVS